MSRSTCRRVRAELLERFRVGEIVLADSEAELDHLGRCSACREEVATDRALVVQLRRALAARIGDASPPERAWLEILRNAQRSDERAPIAPSWWAGVVARLRVGTTIAATGLAFVLAINPQASPPQPSPSPVTTAVPAASSTIRGPIVAHPERPGAAQGSPRLAGLDAPMTAPAPSDGMRPAEIRLAVVVDDDASSDDWWITEPEEVPVLQQPYRSAPAGDVAAEEPEEAGSEAGSEAAPTDEGLPVAERTSVRD